MYFGGASAGLPLSFFVVVAYDGEAIDFGDDDVIVASVFVNFLSSERNKKEVIY